MTVRQWSDTCFAAYVGVTARPFSGTFVGTDSSRDGAEVLARTNTRAWSDVDSRRVWNDEQAGGTETAAGPSAPTGALRALDRRHLTTDELDRRPVL